MRWFWRTPKRIARPNLGHERLVFDPLEPRLLLNADVLSVNLVHDLGAPSADHSLIVQLVQQTEQANNQTVSVQRVQIVDQSTNNAVLAFGDLNEISAVSIEAGPGNTTLTIDAKSFAGHSAPAISFDGGTGHSNIIFDNSMATNWSLTGNNAGTVSGNGVTASFDNVANLTGAANNNDTLTVQQGGALSGTFDGGAGGGNAIVADNNAHQSPIFSSGPQYGTFTLGNNAIQYVEVQSIDVGDPVSASIGNNITATVSLSGTVMDLHYSGADHLFSVAGDGSNNFTLNLGSGDTITVGTLDFTQVPNTNFVINGGGDAIEFQGSFTSNAGLTVNNNATFTQNLTETDIGANANPVISATSINSSIVIDSGISIHASTISLSATSSTTATITTNGSSQLLDSATITSSNQAAITINGTLNSSGDLSVITNVTVNDQVTATDGESSVGRRHHRDQPVDGDAGIGRHLEGHQHRARGDDERQSACLQCPSAADHDHGGQSCIELPQSDKRPITGIK